MTEEAERTRDHAVWKEALRRALPADQADTFVAEFEALGEPFSGQRFIAEIVAGNDPEAVLERAMMVHNYVRQHGWPVSYAMVESSQAKKRAVPDPEAPKPGPPPPTAEEQEAARTRIRYERRLAEISQLTTGVPPSNISRLPQPERAALKDSVERIRDWANRLWTVVEWDDS